jgi:hypothetical protein
MIQGEPWGYLAGTGDIWAADVWIREPSSQLKRSVLSKMKWISRANPNKNTARAINVLRGS